MKRLVNLANVVCLDNIIRMGMSGRPEELAKKLNISRTNFFDTISFLREEMSAPIEYDEHNKIYKYTFIPKFYLGGEIKKTLSNEDKIDIANKESNHDIFEYDIENYEIDDDVFKEKMTSTELIEVYGGLGKEDLKTGSFDDELDNVILDLDINFNDLFIDSY